MNKKMIKSQYEAMGGNWDDVKRSFPLFIEAIEIVAQLTGKEK